MTKFFIVHSYARHGTHVTRTMLDQHPKVTCYNELFRTLHMKIAEPPFAAWNHRPVGRWFDNFTTYRHETNVVGLVMHSDNVIGRRYPARGLRIGRFVAELEWPVIQVFRKNLLETFASHRIAHMTQDWGFKSAGRHTVARVKFKKDDWHTHLRRTLKGIINAQRLMANGQPMIHFWYHDVVADFAAASRKMFKFLGVEQLEFEPTIVKQEIRPLDEVFVNWDDVKRELEGTQWEGCLYGEPPNYLEVVREKDEV